MRTQVIAAVIVLILSVALLLFALTMPASAQEACDLSGADAIDVTIDGETTIYPADAQALTPASWNGVSTWIGGADGQRTLAHEYARDYAWVTYVQVTTITEVDADGQPTGRTWETRTPLHYIEIKANPKWLFVFIMPNDRRENLTDWHGCASFALARDGEVEAWLAALAG